MTVPQVAPIDGGGRCDQCGWRSFRPLVTGLGWRHENCEPAAFHRLMASRRATAHGRYARMVTGRRRWAKRTAREYASLQRGLRL